MMVIVVLVFFVLNRYRDVRRCYRRVRFGVLRFTRHAFTACQVVFTVFDRAAMPFNVIPTPVFARRWKGVRGYGYNARRYEHTQSYCGSG
ncbi:Uncharacterised protein [Mycobacteroides abscessus subsp. abscessus]|nr:Uncharacterised protein [Mycobacteroides abscessus subsp. abscessus]